MVKVRFAPSPTGFIHIGNARIAFFNWLYALKMQGEFILRYDDTDQARSKAEFIAAIEQDLNWLGIKPQRIVFQSQRFARYDEIANYLKKEGWLYPCYETSEELERKRKIQLSRKMAPIYDRGALRLSAAEKARYEKEGRKPHWRFLLPNFTDCPFSTVRTEISWQDKVKGRQIIDLASLSDPVLIRNDDSYLYTLPSIIDDIDMEISDIIRGDDHVTNTGVQLAIFDRLKAKRPAFGHINLLLGGDGEGLSKRKGDLSIRSLREDGFEPMAIASLAVLLGTAENTKAYSSINDLVASFDLTKISKSSARFAVSDLERLNQDIIRNMPYSTAQPALEKLGIAGPMAQDFWQNIKANLAKLKDAKFWWQIIGDESLTFANPSEVKAFLKSAAEFLPQSPWDEHSWQKWTSNIQAQTSWQGKKLFKTLRFALTGQDRGPELRFLLPLMGEKLVRKRLTQN